MAQGTKLAVKPTQSDAKVEMLPRGPGLGPVQGVPLHPHVREVEVPEAHCVEIW